MATTGGSDRQTLRIFFTRQNIGDVIALPPDGSVGEQEDGHHAAREEAERRGITNPTWLFWHTQAGASFDSVGNLIAPLRINWGGDHAHVAQILAQLPEPLAARSTGENGVFLIERTDAAEQAAAPYPDLSDTAAVKSRLQRIRTHPYQPTQADWDWMNTVIESGDIELQAAAVRYYYPGKPDLTDAAYEALMSNWVKIWTKASPKSLIAGFLFTIDDRDDPRLAGVIANASQRKRFTFWAGVSDFLKARGGPEDEELLYSLAQRPGTYPHSAGDRTALEGWIRVRSEITGRPADELAIEAQSNPVFDEGARVALGRIAAAARVQATLDARAAAQDPEGTAAEDPEGTAPLVPEDAM